MAPNNNERVNKALDLLKAGLGPFVEREVQRAVANGRLAEVPWYESDAAGLLRLMWQNWDAVFREVLGPAERGLVGEMRGHRNRWAHQETFSSDDAYRALDSASRLLAAISSPQATEVANIKTELGRLIYDQPTRSEKYKAGSKKYRCPIPECPKVFSGSRGGWDAHIASPKKHPEWHPEIDDPYERKARFKAEFSAWFVRG